MRSNRTISLATNSITFATKYELFPMEQHHFTKLHYSFLEL